MESARDRLVEGLARWAARPTLFAIATLNAITGLFLLATIADANFGADSGLYRRCALRLAEGNTDFCGMLYSPLMELAARPLTWISPMTAMIVMTLVGVVILLAGITLETAGRAGIDRILIGVATLTFAPVVHELLLGQTTLPIAATLYLVAWRTNRARNGVPFGIALALAPKPLLFPILIWMLVWRRRALKAALLTAVALTGLGLVTLGVDQYREWILVLAGTGRASIAGDLSLWERGNFSLWPMDLPSMVIAGAVATAALWTILRDQSRGFVAALLAGLLLAPYSQLYAFSILVLAVKPAIAFAPRATRVLALIANVAGPLLGALTIWSLAGLVASVSRRAPWQDNGSIRES